MLAFLQILVMIACGSMLLPQNVCLCPLVHAEDDCHEEHEPCLHAIDVDLQPVALTPPMMDVPALEFKSADDARPAIANIQFAASAFERPASLPLFMRHCALIL